MTREEDASNLDAQIKPAPRIYSPDRSLVDPNPKTIDELIPRDDKARVVWSADRGLGSDAVVSGNQIRWKVMLDDPPSIPASWSPCGCTPPTNTLPALMNWPAVAGTATRTNGSAGASPSITIRCLTFASSIPSGWPNKSRPTLPP